jgi:hypothetical protein
MDLVESAAARMEGPDKLLIKIAIHTGTVRKRPCA